MCGIKIKKNRKIRPKVSVKKLDANWLAKFVLLELFHCKLKSISRALASQAKNED